MGNTAKTCLLLTGLLFTATGWGQQLEIPIEKVFIPSAGYDDNDPAVEAVIYGELPDPCYSLGESSFNLNNQTQEIYIRQMAWRSTVGSCASGDDVGGPTPFTATISFGKLKEGNYQIHFLLENLKDGIKKFQVEKAKANSTDNFDYAQVTQVQIDDWTLAVDLPVEAVIQGFLPGSCAELDGSPLIDIHEDSVVVLPVIRYTEPADSATPCQKTLKPFRVKVKVNGIKPGDYQLHVRSRDGRSVNRIFTILP